MEVQNPSTVQPIGEFLLLLLLYGRLLSGAIMKGAPCGGKRLTDHGDLAHMPSCVTRSHTPLGVKGSAEEEKRRSFSIRKGSQRLRQFHIDTDGSDDKIYSNSVNYRDIHGKAHEYHSKIAGEQKH
jgi:hypothetical protein